jgi:SAM-dependent methyltransferase
VSESASGRWRDALAAWAIPESILARAPQSPWIHPPELFDVPDTIATSPSHDRAREVLANNATVLDVGCGGGVAALALVPPATHVIGVDHQREMIELFRTNAAARGATCETFEGVWPAIAVDVPRADVVTAHHVVYNVGDISAFLDALNSHARHRVVLELTREHPLANMSGAWEHFWGLRRPSGPTSADLVDVLSEIGIAAQHHSWSAQPRSEIDERKSAAFARIRLCLDASREDEVFEYFQENPLPLQRSLTTIWWDV